MTFLAGTPQTECEAGFHFPASVDGILAMSRPPYNHTNVKLKNRLAFCLMCASQKGQLDTYTVLAVPWINIVIVKIGNSKGRSCACKLLFFSPPYQYDESNADQHGLLKHEGHLSSLSTRCLASVPNSIQPQPKWG